MNVLIVISVACVGACVVDPTPDVSADSGAEASFDVTMIDVAHNDMTTTEVASPDVRADDVATDGAAIGMACASDTDCARYPGYEIRCSYLISGGCAATGVCESTWPISDDAGPDCGAIQSLVYCGCIGTDVHWTGGCVHEYADGYAPAPVMHTGTCGD